MNSTSAIRSSSEVLSASRSAYRTRRNVLRALRTAHHRGRSAVPQAVGASEFSLSPQHFQAFFSNKRGHGTDRKDPVASRVARQELVRHSPATLAPIGRGLFSRPSRAAFSYSAALWYALTLWRHPRHPQVPAGQDFGPYPSVGGAVLALRSPGCDGRHFYSLAALIGRDIVRAFTRR